ncbi:hypothetical protein DFA_12162 [Cavenderia fasciculata]|uniref:Uncharacterized protein n=1 Tax=Cavenderia fasciculata TaxID=261658 RepID=F4QCA9_CACFS|nr:uncharacterized protein DFA_12162 [Cavenderia fasciculata]EGG14390.1 hypothetical protein DFA_12162 [Cavenderia fasciculata]|eukprot:XP_004353799.1 hypothetical protein DFA_12162 [Cavenderia fasciculata]
MKPTSDTKKNTTTLSKSKDEKTTNNKDKSAAVPKNVVPPKKKQQQQKKQSGGSGGLSLAFMDSLASIQKKQNDPTIAKVLKETKTNATVATSVVATTTAPVVADSINKKKVDQKKVDQKKNNDKQQQPKPIVIPPPLPTQPTPKQTNTTNQKTPQVASTTSTSTTTTTSTTKPTTTTSGISLSKSCFALQPNAFESQLNSYQQKVSETIAKSQQIHTLIPELMRSTYIPDNPRVHDQQQQQQSQQLKYQIQSKPTTTATTVEMEINSHTIPAMLIGNYSMMKKGTSSIEEIQALLHPLLPTNLAPFYQSISLLKKIYTKNKLRLQKLHETKFIHILHKKLKDYKLYMSNAFFPMVKLMPSKQLVILIMYRLYAQTLYIKFLKDLLVEASGAFTYLIQIGFDIPYTYVMMGCLASINEHLTETQKLIFNQFNVLYNNFEKFEWSREIASPLSNKEYQLQLNYLLLPFANVFGSLSIVQMHQEINTPFSIPSTTNSS